MLMGGGEGGGVVDIGEKEGVVLKVECDNDGCGVEG